jgi:hypothetical protein
MVHEDLRTLGYIVTDHSYSARGAMLFTDVGVTTGSAPPAFIAVITGLYHRALLVTPVH